MASLDERRAELLAGVPTWYPGLLHLLAINLVTLLAIAGCLARLREVAPWEWALVPLSLAFANLFEWWVHRGPLHRRAPGLARLYERHTRTHHVYFTHERMALRSPRELALVLFPPWMVPLLVLMLAPLALALGLWRWNLAWLFLASGLAYYLLYEWLHLMHHLPPESWLGRRRLVAALRRHHWRHHDPTRMLAGNFNVSFPLADGLLGTVLRDPAPEAPALGAPPRDP
ncbi:MAG: fatty acid hydroxylase family protein [Planctomycetota bacterium]